MIPRDTPYLHRHIDEAVRCAGITSDDHVLEVGCGMGRYTLLMAGMGLHVAGIDLSQVLLDRLQGYNGARYDIDLYCEDLESPPAGMLGRFDVVAGFFVLHHVHDLSRALLGVAALLKPGGRAVFVEPNPLNPLYYVQILLTPGMTWREERGMTRMRPAVMRDSADEAGLADFKAETFGFFPPFLANRRGAGSVERTLERFGPWRRFLPFRVFLAHRRG
jgi:2-polyprenyl-3-methyl-5-hydroxy-6-metoxy-1,4-benzoquinol methylase